METRKSRVEARQGYKLLPWCCKTLSATIFQGLCTSDGKRAVARDWLFHQYLNQLVTTLGSLAHGLPNPSRVSKWGIGHSTFCLRLTANRFHRVIFASIDSAQSHDHCVRTFVDFSTLPGIRWSIITFVVVSAIPSPL